MGRYSNINRKITNEDIFSEHLEDRGVDFIRHYVTPTWVPVPDFIYKQIEVRYYTWKSGDKLRKLSARFYGDSSFWWAIGWFNKRPTDSHYKQGDQVLIPDKLELILSLYGY